MHIIHCNYAQHNAQILAILNEAILSSTALYDYAPRTQDNMRDWFKTKEQSCFPVIGVESDSGVLLGFATYGVFRAWPAYKYSVEHSVYVHRDSRGRGVACHLLEALVEQARAQNYHMLIGAIDAGNTASIALHEKLGFSRCGLVKQAGFKFGQWLDLALYQRLLDTPLQPQDG